MKFTEQEFDLFLRALKFSADKHKEQRRKGNKATPYINHPIDVVEKLYEIGKVRDIAILVAALLHDTVEDTDTSFDELTHFFGEKISRIVYEVTDDKTLPWQERKQLQITTVSKKSREAKLIKLADKICNVRDICLDAPTNWTAERKKQYRQWAKKVIDNLRGTNKELEAEFDYWQQKEMKG